LTYWTSEGVSFFAYLIKFGIEYILFVSLDAILSGGYYAINHYTQLHNELLLKIDKVAKEGQHQEPFRYAGL
jgi:hypothetical protein